MKNRRRVALLALLVVPLGLFVVSKRAADKRPWKLAKVPFCDELRFSPDGKTLVAGVNGRNTFEFHFIGIENKCLLRKQERDDSLLFSPVFSPDGRRIARLEVQTYEPRPTKFQFFSPVFHVSEIGSREQRAIQSRAEQIGDEADAPLDAVWTRDGRKLIIAGVRQIRCFDAQRGKLLSCTVYAPESVHLKQCIEAGLQFEHGIALSPLGGRVLRVETPRLLALRDTATGRVTRRIHASHASSGGHVKDGIGWSPRGSLFWLDVHGASGTRFFRARDGQLLWTWKGLFVHADQNFRFTPDEKQVVACNGSACISRDAQTGRELWRVKAPNSPVFALSPDGKTLAEARDGAIWMWPMPW